MKKYDTVIFDLDGTLLDTLDDLADCVNEALEDAGFPKRTREEIRSFVGNGVARLVALSMPEGVTNPKYNDCLNAFKRLYAQNMRRRTEPYGGIISMLDRLSLEGFKLAVVSNKYDAAVKELCRDYFGAYHMAAFGESDDIARKPAPDIVRTAFDALDCSPDRAVYIGDSEVDVQTAKNAGVDFIGVTWGFRDRVALEKAGARYTIDAPFELLGLIGIQTYDA